MTVHFPDAAGHVLLVDDDENSCRIYRAILEYQGFSVTAVADCAAALPVARRPDLRALLINPVGCDELSLERLRREVDGRGIATLALTSRVTQPELVGVWEQGFDAVLIKPVTPREVAAAVNAVLGLRDPGAARPAAGDGAGSSGNAATSPPALSGARIAFGDRMPSMEFVDTHGVRWRVWSTVPKDSSPLARYYPGGWLTFDAGGTTLRRLSPAPVGWETSSTERLELLCRVATEVPRHTGEMVRMDRPTEGPLANPRTTQPGEPAPEPRSGDLPELK